MAGTNKSDRKGIENSASIVSCLSQEPERKNRMLGLGATCFCKVKLDD